MRWAARRSRRFCRTSRRRVHESDEDKPGVILDYDKEGNVVGIEIPDASKRVENPQEVEYLAGTA